MVNKSRELTLKHLLVPLTLLVFGLISGAVILLWQQHRNRLQQEMVIRANDVERGFAHNMQKQIDSLSMSLLLMAADETIQKSLRMGDKEGFLLFSLHEYVWKPVFAQLQKKHELSFFYVLDAERNCLLRMHQEEQSGDKINYNTLLQAEKTGELAYGLELYNRNLPVLRVVQPVTDDSGIAGYLIMGVKLDVLLRNLHVPETVEIIFTISSRSEKNPSEKPAEGLQLAGGERIFYNSGFDISFLRGDIQEGEIFYRNSYWRFSSLKIDCSSEQEAGRLIVFYDISGEKDNFFQMALFSFVCAFFLVGCIMLFLYRLLRRTDAVIAEQQDMLRQAEEKARKEESARQMNEKVMTIINSIDSMIYIAEKSSGRIIYVNEPGVRFWGNIVNVSYREALQLLGDPEAQSMIDGRSAMPAEQSCVGQRVFQSTKNKKWYECCATQIAWTDGNMVRMEVIRDITAQKDLESRLLQSQKMQSIGKLAGGVAHDFNNMLSVVDGYVELALSFVTPDQPVHKSLLSIRQSVNRSAALTRQLLTFARKQYIAPKIVDINEVITGALKMLTRLIGENIQLNWEPDNGLWKIRVDPSQIDQVMANLCLNARDAINDCGNIYVRTQNVTLNERFGDKGNEVEPGEYVKISVEDDGCGMSEETIKNIFEPFFTTKDVGRGTGLGLATVYGIVTQNQGAIKVRSILGGGSCFEVIFPRYYPAEGENQSGTDDDFFLEQKRFELNIMLVEDEPEVMYVTSMMLKMYNYNVIEQHNPEKAVEMAAKSRPAIDLLITDVVMPKMNGKELAEKLQEFYPDLKVIFISGYTADLIGTQGVLEEEVNFMQKPFTKEELIEKINKVMGDRG